MFSMGTNVIVSSITVGLVGKFGGGTAGWRSVAILYSIIALIVNTLAVMSVREIPEEEMKGDDGGSKSDVKFLESFKLLVKNKYFLMIAGYYLLAYMEVAITTGVGAYYCTYVLRNVSLLGAFSASLMVPKIVGLAITPALVKRFGMYRLNLAGYLIAVVFRVGYVAFGYAGNVPLMLAMTVAAGLFTSPVMGDLNALISETADYTVRTQNRHIEGAMFSCSSFGVKVGSGLGSALSGILLSAGGYVNGAEAQPGSAINMLNFMYLWFPFIIGVLCAVVMYFLKVEKANRDWDAAHGITRS